jgi:hypothetical protein
MSREFEEPDRVTASIRVMQHALSNYRNASFSRAVQQIPLPQRATGHQASHEQYDKDHDRDKEQDARDISSRRGNATEAEDRCHDRNNEKKQCQSQHDVFPLLDVGETTSPD